MCVRKSGIALRDSCWNTFLCGSKGFISCSRNAPLNGVHLLSSDIQQKAMCAPLLGSRECRSHRL